MKKRRFLSSFSVFDIIVIAMCAGLGIAVKPVIAPLAHIITGPFLIPGGTVAGGFYMLFIVLAAALISKPGASTLTCFVQSLLVIITGVIGNHGIMSLVTYLIPGLMADFFYMLLKNKAEPLRCFFMGLIANAAGIFLTNAVFFNLPVQWLALALLAGAVSGGIGGLGAWALARGSRKIFPVFRTQESKDGARISDENKQAGTDIE